MHEDTILRQALQFHFERKLELFETEYQVMDELNARFNVDIIPVDQDTEKLVACLRRNNSALVEQLAICHGSISSLQQQMESLQQLLLSQQERITRLIVTYIGKGSSINIILLLQVRKQCTFKNIMIMLDINLIFLPDLFLICQIQVYAHSNHRLLSNCKSYGICVPRCCGLSESDRAKGCQIVT